MLSSQRSSRYAISCVHVKTYCNLHCKKVSLWTSNAVNLAKF
uniref:Uncharacterized protein n=1 Tax=Arundo donax TaxID=35708 RepID=A0A0A9GKX3_ARUDO